MESWKRQHSGTGTEIGQWSPGVIKKPQPSIVDYFKEFCYKEESRALAGVAQLVGVLSCNQKVAGSIPGQGTCLGCRFSPRSECVQSLVWAHMRGNQSMLLSPIDVSLSLSLSLKKKRQEEVGGGRSEIRIWVCLQERGFG